MRPFRIFIWISIVHIVTAHAQTDGSWNEGSILLKNGTELKGLLKYNYLAGIIGFESATVNKSFSASQLVGFEYFDQFENKQRLFYSVKVTDIKTKVKTDFFFEALRQYETFAVLIKKGTVQISSVGLDANKSNTSDSRVTDMIFLLGVNRQEAVRYMNVVYRETDRLAIDIRIVRSRYVEDDVLDNILGSNKDPVRFYAKNQHLDLEDKEEFLKVLDHFYKSVN
jgi:hypothetical protein